MAKVPPNSIALGREPDETLLAFAETTSGVWNCSTATMTRAVIPLHGRDNNRELYRRTKTPAAAGNRIAHLSSIKSGEGSLQARQVGLLELLGNKSIPKLRHILLQLLYGFTLYLERCTDNSTGNALFVGRYAV